MTKTQIAANRYRRRVSLAAPIGAASPGNHRAGRSPPRHFRASTVTAPNQEWVAGFSHVWTTEGWPCVAAVLDQFPRRIVGWSMKARMTADLVTDALIMAIWRRQPDPKLLHYSDKGSQYTCEQFQKLLADHGIECSMSRLGECHDNAVMESSLSRMKDDRVSRRRYRTRDEARADIFDYIEHFII